MKKLLASVSRKNVALLIIAAVVIALIATTTMKKPTTDSGTNAPVAALGESEMSAMLAKLGAIVKLPPNEKPETQVLSGAAALKKTQPFLENAEDGDVLFLYFAAEVAYLYRPSTNQIVAAGPLHNGPPPAAAGDAPTR